MEIKNMKELKSYADKRIREIDDGKFEHIEKQNEVLKIQDDAISKLRDENRDLKREIKNLKNSLRGQHLVSTKIFEAYTKLKAKNSLDSSEKKFFSSLNRDETPSYIRQTQKEKPIRLSSCDPLQSFPTTSRESGLIRLIKETNIEIGREFGN